MSILADELQADPLGRGYVGMSDQQAADDLNTSYRSVARTVTIDDVRQYLITQIAGGGVSQRSTLDMVREFAEEGTVRGTAPVVSPPTSLASRRSACQMIWYMLQREESTAFFPVDNTNVRNQFIGIGPDSGNGPSVLTAEQLGAIDDLATGTETRAEELNRTVGYCPVPVLGRDVRWARQEFA